jgi:hypothetical protein
MNTIKTNESTPVNCKPVLVNVPTTYRFNKYKESSNQFKKGIVGRWQVFNGYGWDNTKAPESWVDDSEQDAAPTSDSDLNATLKCKLEALVDFRNKVFDQRKDPITASEVIDLLSAEIGTLYDMVDEGVK